MMFKWSTLTLALFCLAVLIRITSGLRCHSCVPATAAQCDKLPPDNPNFDACMRKEVPRPEVQSRYIELRGLSGKHLKENPGFKCEKFVNPTYTICYCFTDGCNSNSIWEWHGKGSANEENGNADGKGNGENGNGGTRVGVDRTIIFGMTLVSAILLKK